MQNNINLNVNYIKIRIITRKLKKDINDLFSFTSKINLICISFLRAYLFKSFDSYLFV